MMGKKIEILAPAGSVEAMKAAYRAGADAAYMGGRLFGARAFASNPDHEELLRAIDYAHIHGKKLYLTVNTLLKNQEIRDSLYDYIFPLYEQGLDAVLVQDLGVLHFLSEVFPDLPLHASTQMTVYGSEYAGWLKRFGIKRIVLPRELSLKEIRRMKEETGLEIEVFTHGALCVCYSGQCLMSSMIGGRSGNRGRCAQPCRLPYTLQAGHEKKQKQGFLLSPKDLCSLDLLPEVIEAGADSLKIEGRMKGPEYAALTANLYRKYADLYLERGKEAYHVEEQDRAMLLESFNRGGFTDGYFKRHNGPEMMSVKKPGHAGVQIGTGKAQGSSLMIALTKDAAKGDLIELPGGSQLRLPQSVSAGGHMRLPIRERLPKGTFPLMRMHSQALSEHLSVYTEQSDLKESLQARAVIKAGQPACMEIVGGDVSVSIKGETPQAAESRPLREEDVRARLNKTGSTPFTFEQISVDLEDGLFMSVPAINALRREALSAYEDTLLKQFRRDGSACGASFAAFADRILPEKSKGGCAISVLVSDPGQLKEAAAHPAVARIYVNDEGDDDWLQEASRLARGQGKAFYIALPHVCRMEKRQALAERIRSYLSCSPDGFLVRNMDSMLALRECGVQLPIISDYSIYAMNDYASSLLRASFDGFTLPLELNRRELEQMADLANGEFLAYGRIPLMLTVQCQQKNAYGCTHHPGWLKLTDRMHKTFPVRNVCSSCYNIIYNSVPLYLPEASALKPASIRLQFLEEEPLQVRQILHVFAQAADGAAADHAGVGDYTKGHYKRGVE